MIINVGARTDIVNYYSPWLLKRFQEGFAYSRNPLFPNKVTRYELVPDKVDAILFCSKNYGTLLPRLREITEKFRTYFYYTVTAYGKDVEPNVPDLETSVSLLRELSKLVGKEKTAWRYDPVLLTDSYPIQRHIETFEWLCDRLAPYVDRCIFSFVEMYPRLQTYMPEIIPITKEEKRTIAARLGAIAKKYAIPIQTCGHADDYSEFGIMRSGCATLKIIGQANACKFRNIPHRGTRRGCSCIESRDLGWYDTCPNLCKYCYANHGLEEIRKNVALHDEDSPILIGHLNPDDKVMAGNQTSFLKTDERQISLFDL